MLQKDSTLSTFVYNSKVALINTKLNARSKEEVTSAPRHLRVFLEQKKPTKKISFLRSNFLDYAGGWEEESTTRRLEPTTQPPQTARWNEEQQHFTTRAPGRPPSETVSQAQLRIIGERVVFR